MMMSEPTSTPDTNIVLMQKGCVLRVTMKECGAVRVSIDHNIIHEVSDKDILLLIGCVRQLEHTLLTHYNQRTTSDDED